jgi:signal transduction histidine kinase
MQSEALSGPRTTLLRIMHAVNVVNSASWGVFLFVRYLRGFDASKVSFVTSCVGAVFALFGLALTGRYAKASGWILVSTSISSTLFAALYLDPLRAGLALFFLSVPVAIAALMLSSKAGIKTFFVTLVGLGLLFAIRADLPIESTLPPFAFLAYLSAIILVATFVKERLERTHEARLAESAKMASLGLMSAGIAHEINNPLFVLNVAASQLEEVSVANQLDRPRLIELSRKISDMTQRIEQTVNGMKQFAREASADPVHMTPVKDVLSSIRELCRYRFNEERVQLQIPDVAPALSVPCRPVQLSQVLVNLLNNALDAVTGSAEKWVRVEILDRGTALQIVVTDSGPGVPAEIRSRIMNPFFTTKTEGRGTGLGLSLSLAIARDHGGRLFLDPDSPHTRFVLELPQRPEGQGSHPS